MSKKVLILDDSEIVSSLTAFLVGRLGYESVQFNNGEDVLKYIEDTENSYPDIIIADHSLTTAGSIRKTAFKILQKLKSFGVDIPVIMASGCCTDKVMDKYKKLGIKSFICKDDVDYIEKLSEEVTKLLKSYV